MPDPVNGNMQVTVRRRRTRRHRRNRQIRRWLALGTLGVLTVSVSTLALMYFSPSLFRAGQSSPSTFGQSERSRSHELIVDRILAHTQVRPVYPYSVVPGGVEDAKELKWIAEHDPVVGAHYAGFDYDRARLVQLTQARTVYLSYRIGNRIYWTRRRVTLHKGEKLITDGRMTARTRCANRVEEQAQQEASPAEPPVQKFDEPVQAGNGTAVQSPPVPFQSALLDRPAVSGLGPAGPLSMYDPFVGGNWVSIAPPPLPVGLCEPTKKKGSSDDVAVETHGKKTKLGPCGGGPIGVVPEPGTWVLFASGLAAIYWCARRKLSRA